MEKTTDTPAWNNDKEYPSLESSAFAADEAAIKNGLEKLKVLIAQAVGDKPNPQGIQEAFRQSEHIGVLVQNLSTFVRCLLSIDASDTKARAKLSQLEELGSTLEQIVMPANLLMQRCDEALFTQIVSNPIVNGYEFTLREQRKMAKFLLSESEETLLKALSTSGHLAWGQLWESLVGNATVQLKYPDRTESLGLAQAHSLIFSADPIARETAWHGIQNFWTEHRQTGAAILNALAGWRFEVCRRRSHTKPLHFLDQPAHESRITRETLEALIAACRNRLSGTRQSLVKMAKIMGKPKLDPWDLFGPAPAQGKIKTYTFAEGIKLIRQAFHNFDPRMAEFVDTMVDQQWIDARVLPKKAYGAYCTGFPKSLEPRVFQSYAGSPHDVVTLAHELGHAYHSWVMRDLPRGQQEYPMTLAETASVFGETLLRDHLETLATSRDEKIDCGWMNLESAAAYLINIPARFEFEKAFYELRQNSSVSADELSDLHEKTWESWYGPTLTRYDRLFWAHKAHFSIAGTSFYNFPYSFGYLFSLSVYVRRKEYGSKFAQIYVDLLRDTGRMTAEDLVMKHLKEDIRQPAFWEKAIAAVEHKIAAFEV